MHKRDKDIIRWAKKRGIMNDPEAKKNQPVKTAEEVSELIDAFSKQDRKSTKDAIGDIYVTLVIQGAMDQIDSVQTVKDIMWYSSIITVWSGVDSRKYGARHTTSDEGLVKHAYLLGKVASIASLLGFTLDECVEHAWNQIKDRKGKMVNGLFVKEESR